MKPFRVLQMRKTSTVVTDPSFANTILLCGCNGTHAAPANLVDESFAAHTAGVAGGSGAQDTQYDTGNKVFGASSAYFDTGLNDYVLFTDHADWTLGSSNFTMEFFWRNETLANLTSTMSFLSHYNDTGNQRGWVLQYQGGSTQLAIFASPDGTSTAGANVVTGSWTPSNATWYYICGERSGTTFRLYAGPLGGTAAMVGKATSSMSFFDCTAPLEISSVATNETQCINGWMDEIRITKTARYATDAGYAVPTSEFPRS